MLKFFEDAIRGGLSFIADRLCETEGTKKAIFHIDMNNLYGTAQGMPLPIGDFYWHPNPEIFMKKEILDALTLDSEEGYYLEVDLSYPTELHSQRSHFYFPCCPETKVMKYDDLSKTSKELLIQKRGSKTEAKKYKSVKLVSSFLPKKKYKLHYMALLQCLRFGLKLEHVHRVVCFRQMRFAKPFLDFMTQKRSQSRSKLEENQCKNIANQLYGKSIERYVYAHIFFVSNFFNKNSQISILE